MKLALLWPLACALISASANAAMSDDILAQLSRCDGAFFQTLHRHAGELASTPAFTKGRDFAYFKVADRADASGSLLTFGTPPRLGGFEVKAYFDQHMALSAEEAFVAWGFVLKAPIEDVIKATEPLIWDSDRLQKSGPAHIRTEVWEQANKDQGWQKVVTPGGAEPQPGTVERTLLIEPDEKDASLTRFGCTLQGALTAELLRAARPDIEARAKGRK